MVNSLMRSTVFWGANKTTLANYNISLSYPLKFSQGGGYPESIYSRQRGGNRSSFLSWEEEEELLAEIGKRAGQELLVVKTIKTEIESRVGWNLRSVYQVRAKPGRSCPKPRP